MIIPSRRLLLIAFAHLVGWQYTITWNREDGWSVHGWNNPWLEALRND